MIESTKKWVVQRPDSQLVQQLQRNLGISAIAAKILVARGCTSEGQASSLLKVDEQYFHDPYAMHGMEQAVERILQALEEGEKILVYGDYDGDGITSTTVMLNVLLDLGADVDLRMDMVQMKNCSDKHMKTVYNSLLLSIMGLVALSRFVWRRS